MILKLRSTFSTRVSIRTDYKIREKPVSRKKERKKKDRKVERREERNKERIWQAVRS